STDVRRHPENYGAPMNAPERPSMGEAQPVLGWSERNQRWLTSQLEALGARIETLAATPTPATEGGVNDPIVGPTIARSSPRADHRSRVMRGRLHARSRSLRRYFRAVAIRARTAAAYGRRGAGQRAASLGRPGARRAAGRRTFVTTDVFAGAAGPRATALGCV